MDLLAQALEYADMGLAVLPLYEPVNGKCSCGKERCTSPGKHPRIAGGSNSASKNIEQIKGWWAKWPDANIGIATGVVSGILAVDVDCNGDKHGDLSIKEWESQHTPLPRTWISQTGSGGYHCFFKCTDSSLKNRAGILEGVDIRANGGYIVAPPSLHICENRYEWKRRPGEVPLASLPAEFDALIKSNKQQLYYPTVINEGMRNDTLFRLACSLRAKGLSEIAVLSAIKEENRMRCSPPLEDHEIERIVQSASRYPPGSSVKYSEPSVTDSLAELHPEKNSRYSWNDIGSSNLFADWYKRTARYVPERKQWYIYDGKAWREDTGNLQVMELCKELADKLMLYALGINDEQQRQAYIGFVKRWQIRRNRETILKDAASVYPVLISEFDSNPDLFNCLNGTVELKTGAFRSHNPEDMLSKISGVSFDPKAVSSRWERFISEVLSEDPERAMYLQKAAGYALSGDTQYETLFILYGPTTRNGKSTCMETILSMMGEYGKAAQPDILGMKQNMGRNAPSEDVARLSGARLVNISEPDKKLVLSSAMVKTLTGNDTLNARFLHENSFDFKPQFKLFINTNHLPAVTDMTLFNSGRVIIIPFTRHFEEQEQDKQLKRKLSEPNNLSGVLNWCLEGYRLLNEQGFAMPDSIRAATDEYRYDSDKVGQFAEEMLIKDPQSEVRTSEVYGQYQQWCEHNGHHAESIRNFKPALERIDEVVRKRPKGGGNMTTILMGYRLPDCYDNGGL